MIAFALSLQIESDNREFIQTISVAIVMTTTLIGASMLKSFMKCIRMEGDEEEIEPENMYVCIVMKSKNKRQPVVGVGIQQDRLWEYRYKPWEGGWAKEGEEIIVEGEVRIVWVELCGSFI